MYDAQELGLKYSKMNVQALKRQIQELSPSELDAYRVGVRLSLEDQVYRTANSANEALKIFGKEIQKKQLKLVLGKDYEEFKKKMIREINFNDTKNRILGNSRTDYNQIDDASFAQSVVNSVRGGAIQATRYIVDAVADSLVNKYTGINEKNAKEIAEILLDNKKGIQYIQKLIKQQKTPLQKSLTDDIVNDFKDTL